MCAHVIRITWHNGVCSLCSCARLCVCVFRVCTIHVYCIFMFNDLECTCAKNFLSICKHKYTHTHTHTHTQCTHSCTYTPLPTTIIRCVESIHYLYSYFHHHSTNVPDQRRSVGSIVISPLGNLAALVDGFGRVLVMDVESLAVRRM